MSTIRFWTVVPAITAVAFASQMASATVIISNFPQANDGSSSTISSFLGDSAKAAGFTMPAGSAFNLDLLTMRLDPTAGATLSVQLFGGDAFPVGPALLNFTNPNLPAGAGNFVFTPVTKFLLRPSTTYWIAATGKSPTMSDATFWLASHPGIVPTGLATSEGYRFDNNGMFPPTQSSSILNTYQVDGTAVPEPATLTLVGLGLLAFVGRKGRTRT